MGTTATIIMPPPAEYNHIANPQQRHVIKTYCVSGVLFTVASIFLIGTHLIWKRITKLIIHPTEKYAQYIAFGSSLSTQILLLFSNGLGLIGVHAWDLSPQRYNLSAKLLFTAFLLYIVSTASAKVAAFCFLGRIMVKPRVQWVCVGLTIIGYIILGICVCFACEPNVTSWRLFKNWNYINRGTVYVFTAGFGTVVNTAILIVPGYLIWNVQIKTKKKVVSILDVGAALALLSSVCFLVSLKPVITSPDQTWTLSLPIIYLITDVNLSFISYCYLSIPAIFKHLLSSREARRPEDDQVDLQSHRAHVSLKSFTSKDDISV